MAYKYSTVFDFETKTTTYYQEDENGLIVEINEIPVLPDTEIPNAPQL